MRYRPNEHVVFHIKTQWKWCVSHYRPNEHVVGNVVEMSSVLQPRPSRTYVISGTLAFHLTCRN